MERKTKTMHMGDKEILKDALSSQKFITANYNNYAGECANLQLRNQMLSILKEEHTLQSDIFNEMYNRGWYKVSPAEKQKISTAKTTYPPQPKA